MLVNVDASEVAEVARERRRCHSWDPFPSNVCFLTHTHTRSIDPRYFFRTTTKTFFSLTINVNFHTHFVCPVVTDALSIPS